MKLSLLIVAGLVVATLGCKTCLEPLPDPKPVVFCKRQIKRTLDCPGRIMADGVSNCERCFSSDSYSEKDLVASCYSDDYSVYCVSLVDQCDDGVCRNSPLRPPEFLKKPGGDGGPRRDSGDE